MKDSFPACAHLVIVFVWTRKREATWAGVIRGSSYASADGVSSAITRPSGPRARCGQNRSDAGPGVAYGEPGTRPGEAGELCCTPRSGIASSGFPTACHEESATDQQPRA